MHGFLKTGFDGVRGIRARPPVASTLLRQYVKGPNAVQWHILCKAKETICLVDVLLMAR